MKLALVLAAALSISAAVVAALILPVVSQEHIVAKRTPPEMARRELAHREHVQRVLTAFNAGDPAVEGEARRMIAGLRPSDFSLLGFAAALDKRGEAREAYGLVHGYAHFLEHSVTDDREMAFYARLAEQTGHPEEAAWARDRMGEEGHFRIWRRAEEYTFAERPQGSMRTHSVNRQMDYGLHLYPAHRTEIETLRQELLAAP